MKPFDHQQHNRLAWNRLAKAGNRFAIPAKASDFDNPLASVDGPGWLGSSISGKRVLCLAAGGGRQGPLYAAAGAEVTVVDISSEMLEIDRQLATSRKLSLRTVETSMEDLSMFADQSFDIVIQPVSTCYVPDVQPVFNEVGRVTSFNGVYVSQHKQPASLQTSIEPMSVGYFFVHEWSRSSPLPAHPEENQIREPGTFEFVHTFQQLISTMCRAGFVIEDAIEPDHANPSARPGTFEHRSRFVQPYIRFKARRTSNPVAARSIWSPVDV